MIMQSVEQQLVKQLRLYNGDKNPHWKGDDLLKRTCSQCQSKETHIDKGNDRPQWYKNKQGDGFLCIGCYTKNYTKTRIQ
jgi:hypothetical protein